MNAFECLERSINEFHTELMCEFLKVFNGNACLPVTTAYSLGSYIFRFNRSGESIFSCIEPLRGKHFDLSLEENILLFKYMISTECWRNRVDRSVATHAPGKLQLWKYTHHPKVHQISPTLQVHWIKQSKKNLLRLVRHADTAKQVVYINSGVVKEVKSHVFDILRSIVSLQHGLVPVHPSVTQGCPDILSVLSTVTGFSWAEIVHDFP